MVRVFRLFFEKNDANASDDSRGYEQNSYPRAVNQTTSEASYYAYIIIIIIILIVFNHCYESITFASARRSENFNQHGIRRRRLLINEWGRFGANSNAVTCYSIITN